MPQSARPPHWSVLSALPGVAWPAVPSAAGAMLLAVLKQLDGTQWLPAQELRRQQQRQLEPLLQHAHATVPHYRERWREARPGDLSALPVLTRRELQQSYESLKSTRIPPAHGDCHEARTSGSTGTPVRVLKTALTGLLWNALTLRDHQWHARDFRAKLAAIRRGMERGQSPTWGSATAGLIETGPCVQREVDASAQALLEWVAGEDPDYLLTYPSLAAEMARIAIASGTRLARLREVRALGESVAPETRALCREAWGAKLSDTYSSEEVGYIALQCPGHEHYHVQSETVVVEVLDERDAPCAPGQVGRVVVTPLHNFAMPLIRYEIGDYAEVGEACACGRGLPVLRRILGRVRNMLVTASGERYWPTFGQRAVFGLAPVMQQQFVQTAYDTVEARLVVAAPLSPEQQRLVQEGVRSRLPPGFRVNVVYAERLARGAGGKFEDFISEVA